MAWSGSAVRNERDVEAHPILSAISVTILLVSYIGTDASRIARDLEARHLHAMFWLILLLSSALPSILLAWSEREV